jgi:hypothetical protein
MAPWEQDIVMSTSQYRSIHTKNVVIEGIRFIALARHDENGLFEHRSPVGGALYELQAKITQQREPHTEKMRRMYPCAVDVEVECKSDYSQRLVYDSIHIRTMNVREARSPSLPGRRLRMSRYVNGSNP